MKNNKALIIGISINLAVIIIAIVLIYSAFEKRSDNVIKSFYGTVKSANNEIIKIETTDKEIIEVNSNEEVNQGDLVEVTYYDIGSDTIPSIEVIAEHKELTTTATTTTQAISDPKIVDQDKDEYITNYFKDLYGNIKSGETKEKLKDKFITVVDFIFYNKKINGITFNELSNSVKEKVIYYALLVDSKINEIFPDYKEKLSNKYNTAKDKLVTDYLEGLVFICESDKDKCEAFKEDFQVVKSKVSITWNNFKEVIINAGISGINKISEWYKIWSGKA